MPRLTYLFLFSLVLMLSSCFEVIEKVDLNQDGSGDFELTLNLSQSKSEIDAARLLDSSGQIQIPSVDYLETQILRGMDILTNSKGISTVDAKRDYENYIFKLSFHFDSLEALNSAVQQMYGELSALNYSYAGVFRMDSESFSRKMDEQSIAIFNKIAEKNPKMVKDATYTGIYRFQEEVSNCYNPFAKISKSHKAVMVKTPIQNIVKGDRTISTAIQLKHTH